MDLQQKNLKNFVKQMVPRRGLPETYKNARFTKVLGLKVSGQGKLEFESDLSTMLIKHTHTHTHTHTQY